MLSFSARDMREARSGLAWNVSVERSHWQISFSEGRAPAECQDGLWDPDMALDGMAAQPRRNVASAVLREQVSRVLHPSVCLEE